MIAEGKEPGVVALEVDFDRTTGTGVYENTHDANPNISATDWPTYVFKNKAVVGNVPISDIGDGVNTDPLLAVSFEIIPIFNGMM